MTMTKTAYLAERGGHKADLMAMPRPVRRLLRRRCCTAARRRRGVDVEALEEALRLMVEAANVAYP